MSVGPSEPLILGIESSCDETAAAVVSGGLRILSNVVASQVEIHRKYGGVVPELASREHLRRIVPVVREAADQARIQLQELDAIAVTSGPGLIGALLVGVTYGKTLAQALHKPLIAVNHLEGHVHAVLLEAHAAGRDPRLPAVCLIVSGGHTILYEVRAQASNGARLFSYNRIGGTRDDAAGEAYDKVARMLALGYPGGPIIDRLAAHGNPSAVRFASAKMSGGNPHDFSFSGIKTAVLYHLRRNPHLQAEIERRQHALSHGERAADRLRALSSGETLDLIASFQRAVVESLVARTLAAAEELGIRTVLVSGGVAANSELRRSFETESGGRGIAVFFPSRALSTDNAAMIAAAGYARFLAGERSGVHLDPSANLPLA
ncbi:MAG: tRNA (adenosine(37)-N6)-threonylcarbamoyltransferase complex transferase subunit TsaD [Acidobacteriota bacterium]|nr:tRNA (adenosine(37)-N6)-threonylcarbamoyltransferase complex transferase subunit TsaD [Acidobacteriota bacterium]